MCIERFWWVEGPDGELARVGRWYDEDFNTVFEHGIPNLQRTMIEAEKLCKEGEKPVPVKIVKESEYAKG